MTGYCGRKARGGAAALAVSLAIAGCGSGDRPRAATVAPRREVLANFIAEVDPVARTVTVTPLPGGSDPGALSYWTALQEIPIVQNGTWGDAGEGTVEMLTTATRTYTGGCNGSDRFEADITIHSGFAATALLRPYVEMVDVTPDTYRSCLSVPAPQNILGERTASATYGLFQYPDIAAHGESTATWSFAVPSYARFTFHGRLVAQPVELTPPTTTAVPAGGTRSAQTITLSCSDGGGSGCADTYFTVDGAASTAYTAPLRLSGAHRVCFNSVDVNGAAETIQCEDYVITGPIVAAEYDASLHVPVCGGHPSSCGTGALLVGVGGTATSPEAHAPNTLDGCADRAMGANYHVDALSVDSITVATEDGGPIAPGKQVVLTASVWSFLGAEALDVFYATTTTSPAWTYIATANASATGSQQEDLTIPFPLPSDVVALRVHFGDTSIALSSTGCDTTNAQDTDDIVLSPFALGRASSAPTVSFVDPTNTDPVTVVARTILVRVDAPAETTESVELFSAPDPTAAPPPETAWTSRGVDRARPWVFSYDTNANAGGPTAGSTLLLAKVTDNAGHVTYSSAIPITVYELTPPVVSNVAPAQGATISKATPITLTVTATDSGTGIYRVDWYVDGNPTAVASTQTGLPQNQYQATWNASALVNGVHTVVARIQDFSSNYAQTPRVTFTLTD